MPKDNEVDEKVIVDNAARELIADMKPATFTAYSREGVGMSVTLCVTAEEHERIVGALKATVAELRAEVERLRTDAYKFRRLARLLDGFDFRLGRNVLMPPATYLDSVEITCEFQPGVGQSVIDAIMDTLTGADPT